MMERFDMTGGQSVFQVIEAVAARNPDAPALSGDGETWTYRSLLQSAERFAAFLDAKGCGPGTTLGILADNNPLTCVLWLGAARIGATVCLLNSLLTASELAAILGNLQPRLIVTDDGHEQLCREAVSANGADAEIVSLRRTALLNQDPFEGSHPAASSAHEISYTSGTTGVPKGAVLTHDIVVHRARQEGDLFGLTPADVALVVTPLFHQSGIRNAVLTGWVAGAHTVITPRFDRTRFWQIVAQHKATYTCMVETMLLLLERVPESEEERSNTLRQVMGGGDTEVLARCERRFGIRLVQGYGMTENGVAVAVPPSLPEAELDRLRRWGQGAFLAGWPLEGTEIRLVGDDGPVAGEGAKGEIHMRSPGLFRDYFRRPDATEETFSDGWFKTGDQGMWGPDGAIYFVDRIRDVIRRGGENVASKQIEEVLNAHPDVANAAVIPVPDPVFMQEIKAVIVPRAEARIVPSDLWAWCEGRLAAYKIPRYLEFRDSLPLSGSGRVQKQVLRDQGLAGVMPTYDRRESVS